MWPTSKDIRAKSSCGPGNRVGGSRGTVGARPWPTRGRLPELAPQVPAIEAIRIACLTAT